MWDAKVARSTTRLCPPHLPTSRCPREHHLGPSAPLSCTQPLPASPLQPKLVSLPASSCAARRSFVWPQLMENRYGATPRASWALTATSASPRDICLRLPSLSPLVARLLLSCSSRLVSASLSPSPFPSPSLSLCVSLSLSPSLSSLSSRRSLIAIRLAGLNHSVLMCDLRSVKTCHCCCSCHQYRGALRGLGCWSSPPLAAPHRASRSIAILCVYSYTSYILYL